MQTQLQSESQELLDQELEMIAGGSSVPADGCFPTYDPYQGVYEIISKKLKEAISEVFPEKPGQPEERVYFEPKTL